MSKNFSTTITIAGKSQQFDFLSMDITGPRLYHVYTDWEGKRIRFHIQKNSEGVFKIAMPEHCPEAIVKAESELEDAILRQV